MSVIQIDELIARREEPVPTDMEAFLAWMQELSDSVPLEEWAKLPTDLAENFDDYAYGGKAWPA